MFKLVDNEGNDIYTEDIIMHENLKTKEVTYYLCGKNMLYRYDDYGLFSHNGLRNIKLDNSVTLVNNEVSIWTRMDTESEVFDEIFG
jgi:hypothetical protein